MVDRDITPRSARPARLNPKNLLRVVPLVECTSLVDALVALQAYQLGACRLGYRARQLGLTDTGRALDEQRFAQTIGQEDCRRGGLVGQIAGFGQPFDHVVDGREERRRVGKCSVHG